MSFPNNTNNNCVPLRWGHNFLMGAANTAAAAASQTTNFPVIAATSSAASMEETLMLARHRQEIELLHARQRAQVAVAHARKLEQQAAVAAAVAYSTQQQFVAAAATATAVSPASIVPSTAALIAGNAMSPAFHAASAGAAMQGSTSVVTPQKQQRTHASARRGKNLSPEEKRDSASSSEETLSVKSAGESDSEEDREVNNLHLLGSAASMEYRVPKRDLARPKKKKQGKNRSATSNGTKQPSVKTTEKANGAKGRRIDKFRKGLGAKVGEEAASSQQAQPLKSLFKASGETKNSRKAEKGIINKIKQDVGVKGKTETTPEAGTNQKANAISIEEKGLSHAPAGHGDFGSAKGASSLDPQQQKARETNQKDLDSSQSTQGEVSNCGDKKHEVRPPLLASSASVPTKETKNIKSPILAATTTAVPGEPTQKKVKSPPPIPLEAESSGPSGGGLGGVSPSGKSGGNLDYEVDHSFLQSKADNPDFFSTSTSTRTYLKNGPEIMDVLSFKGNQTAKSLTDGHKLFRELIQQQRELFKNTSSRKIKSAAGRSIVQAIVAAGGRFAKRECVGGALGRYYLLTLPEALKKTSKALNDAAKQAQFKKALVNLQDDNDDGKKKRKNKLPQQLPLTADTLIKRAKLSGQEQGPPSFLSQRSTAIDTMVIQDFKDEDDLKRKRKRMLEQQLRNVALKKAKLSGQDQDQPGTVNHLSTATADAKSMQDGQSEDDAKGKQKEELAYTTIDAKASIQEDQDDDDAKRKRKHKIEQHSGNVTAFQEARADDQDHPGNPENSRPTAATDAEGQSKTEQLAENRDPSSGIAENAKSGDSDGAAERL